MPPVCRSRYRKRYSELALPDHTISTGYWSKTSKRKRSPLFDAVAFEEYCGGIGAIAGDSDVDMLHRRLAQQRNEELAAITARFGYQTIREVKARNRIGQR